MLLRIRRCSGDERKAGELEWVRVLEAEVSRLKSQVSRMWKPRKVDLFLIILKNSILTNEDRLHIARCLLGKKINLFLCGGLKSFSFCSFALVNFRFPFRP